MKILNFLNQTLEIKKILGKYPVRQKASAVMPLLDFRMRQCKGWIPEAAMHEIGRIIDMPFIRVYEVASFYSMFNLKPIREVFYTGLHYNTLLVGEVVINWSIFVKNIWI